MKYLLPVLIFTCFLGISNNCFAQLKAINENIFFGLGGAVISNQDAAKLDSIALKLQAFDVVKISFTGYADSIGDSSANIKLSLKRSEAVYNAFLERGANPQIIKLEGQGENNPIASNSVEEGRQKNRRVAVKIVYRPVSENKSDTDVDTFKIGRKNGRMNFVIQTKKIWCPPADTLTRNITPDIKYEVIRLPNGTLVEIEEQEFKLKKDCIKLEGSFTAEQLAEKGIATNINGKTMVVASAFNLKLCDNKCLDNQVRYWVPATEVSGLQVYLLGDDEKFKKMNLNVDLIRRGDTSYYKFQTACPGSFYGMGPCVRNDRSIEIIAKKALKVDSIFVVKEEPFMVNNMRKKDRSFTGKIPIGQVDFKLRVAYNQKKVKKYVVINSSSLSQAQNLKEKKSLNKKVMLVRGGYDTYVLTRKVLKG